MKSNIKFIDEKLQQSFESLKDSRTEDRNLYKWIYRALEDIENDAYCGIQIKKRLFPKKYVQEYFIKNLWKYDLPNGWRLMYTIGDNKINILSIILEWMTHKEYDRRFGY